MQQWLLNKYNYVIKKIVDFAELQLAINLISLPILISWGLPLSYASLIGNAFFTPLLILFLWTSSIFTVCICLGFFYTLPTWILQQITGLWQTVLSWSQPTWIFGFNTNLFIPSLICCLIIWLWYSFVKATSQKNILLFCILLSGMLLIQRNLYYKNNIQKLNTIDCHLITIHNKKYLIDHGGLCTRKNSFSHIDYTVFPELIKAQGSLHIDTLIILKPSMKIERVIKEMVTSCQISTIIVTKEQQCYHKLKKLFQETDINILPLLNKRSRLKKHQLDRYYHSSEPPV